MNLVNIIYRYVNRFINSAELIKLLENIDESKFSDEKVKDLAKLTEDVKEIVNTVPNEIDAIEEKRLETINRMLEAFKKTLDNDNLEDEGKEFVENNIITC